MADSSSLFSSGNRDHNGSYLVYMNGIEVPVEGVSISYGVWQIPEATITMAPDPVLQRMGSEDRIQVVVFFCDDFLIGDSGDPATFRVLFEGEIVGWGYQVSPNGRALTFQAVNQIAIFTQLFVQFLMNTDDMAAHFVDITQGTADMSYVHSEITWPFSLFQKGLTGADQITHPYEFMYNLIKNMCGSSPTVPDAQRSVPAANFFTRWARLTNFINRFIATPTFDEGAGDSNIFPVLAALQQTSALDVLTQSLLRQIQNSGSMWDMLQLVYQTMFMEIAMLPTAPLVSADLITGAIQPTDFSFHTVTATNAGEVGPSQDAGFQSTSPASPLMPNRLVNYFAKPQFLFGLPPACNVMFPSQIEMWNYDENFATQPTRLYFNDEVVNRLLKPNGVLADAVMNALATAYPPEADIFNKARLTGAQGNGKNFLLWPEEFFKGPVIDRRPLPTWFFILKQLEQGAKTPADSTGTDGSPAIKNPFEGVSGGAPTVYQLYAEYEFYRERYSRRAGAAIIKFNPFIVPGFPGVIFDNRASRMDIFCYVMAVRHELRNRSINTTVTYSYGRTIQEMTGLMASIFNKGGAITAVAPREPIKSVRDVIQQFSTSDDFYRKLLFGNADALDSKMAGFDWTQAIGYLNTDGSVEPIVIVDEYGGALSDYNDAKLALDEVSTQISSLLDANSAPTSQLNGITASIFALENSSGRTPYDDANLMDLQEQAVVLQTQINLNNQQLAAYQQQQTALMAQLTATKPPTQSVEHNLDPDSTRIITPTAAFADMFTYYDAAMQFNWRPICSMDEYIVFYQSTAEGFVPAFGSPRSVGADYYERLRTLTPLTDEAQPSGVGGLPPSLESGGSGPAIPVGLPPTFAQTRKDWDQILLEYRNNVYISKIPRG